MVRATRFVHRRRSFVEKKKPIQKSEAFGRTRTRFRLGNHISLPEAASQKWLRQRRPAKRPSRRPAASRSNTASGFFGIDEDQIPLHHDDILGLLAALLSNAKLQRIFGSLYPALFIDEHQDTDPLVMTALSEKLLATRKGRSSVSSVIDGRRSIGRTIGSPISPMWKASIRAPTSGRPPPSSMCSISLPEALPRRSTFIALCLAGTAPHVDRLPCTFRTSSVRNALKPSKSLN
jgi:hypothetical protein